MRRSPCRPLLSEAIGDVTNAAAELNRLREGWLNPPSMDSTSLAKRTLTNLYNAPPTWLLQAHEQLDCAVHIAYGWPYPLDDDDILARLLDLNLERAESRASSFAAAQDLQEVMP